jgi:hypothetical protein
MMFGTDATALLAQAVADVAERSFFAYAEPCDAGRFGELTDGVARWYTASVRFDEPGLAGVVACVLPEDLVLMLFDAFTGRDYADPPADAAAVNDLIGELANMVCGAWLTRVANDQTFTLRAPEVTVNQAAAPAGDGVLLMAMNDRPVAVLVRELPALPAVGAA